MRDTQEHIIYGDVGRDAPATEDQVRAMHDRHWLSLAEQCHRSSTDFLDANFRKQWEANLAHWNNEHSIDSRFYDAKYKNRNKLFRPKTRSISIRGEAAMVRALFTTDDLVSVKPEDDNNAMQRISAEINQELLQYRLTKTIPWYQTCVGAYQDCFNFGICISYQYWEFETRIHRIPTGAIGEDGQESFIEELEVVTNKPCVDLIRPENFRFDNGSDWRDVIGTSPFLERIVPMTVQAVEEKMDPTMNRKPWKEYDRARIVAASRGMDTNESTRMAREGRGKQDPQGGDRQLPNDFDTVFCREYFVRQAGVDWVFWTIGHQLLLTEPVPIEEAYFHGKRPFSMGTIMLEAHKTVPASKNQLIAPIQVGINKLANQRADNVDLVLNKRYFLRRGQNIDTPALMRNVPGGGVYMDDPETDVKIVSTPDVTSSSYEEHNRLSSEMDEIAGNFSISSVAANRQLNETVGGMKISSAASDEITEYGIVTFIKTWVESTLRQLLLLEQAYEDDQVILQLAAGRSNEYQKINLQGDVPLQVLTQDLSVTVNVGIGNTDPVTRQDNFAKSLGIVVSVMPQLALRLNEDEVIKEVMGSAGRKDGQRFFKPADQVQAPVDPAVAEAEAKEATARFKIEQETMLRMIEMENENNRFYAQLASTKDISLEKLYADLGKNANDTKFKMISELNKARELEFKRTTGRQGI